MFQTTNQWFSLCMSPLCISVEVNCPFPWFPWPGHQASSSVVLQSHRWESMGVQQFQVSALDYQRQYSQTIKTRYDSEKKKWLNTMKNQGIFRISVISVYQTLQTSHQFRVTVGCLMTPSKMLSIQEPAGPSDLSTVYRKWYLSQWVDLTENLQETRDFPMTYGMFL